MEIFPKSPKCTSIAPSLKQYIKALLNFVQDEEPSKIPVRTEKLVGVYLWSNASGLSLGYSIYIDKESLLDIGYGFLFWRIKGFCEVCNLVKALEKLLELGKIKVGTEV